MNTSDPSTLNPPPQPAASETSGPSPAPAEPSSGAPAVSPYSAGRRRVGKVARLPKATRDKINHMLQEGQQYAAILEALGPEVEGITEDNICRWKSGGYQDWLREQQALEAVRLRQDFILELATSTQPVRLHQVSMQLAAAGIAELLVDVNMRMLRGPLEEEPDKLVRLCNAAARLNDSEIRSERHLREEHDRQAKLSGNSDKPKVITRESLRKAEEALRLL